MKISDIDDNTKLVDFENFFEVYENGLDKRRPYIFNLNSTIYFEGIPTKEYKLSHDMFWTTISYELYQTPRLWWILMKLNNVNQKNMFNAVRASETVKYIDQDDVRSVLMNFVN